MINYNTKFVTICGLLHIITLTAGKLVSPSVLGREHNLKADHSIIRRNQNQINLN